jgi:adenylate cyclase
MSQSRRLAAILAADVVGYSRLMGVDEEGTLERLKALRSELIDPNIAKHHGRIVKTTGDGLLVEFASVVDAVRCAAVVQQAVPEWNAGVAAVHRIELRIGINLGDVIADGDDLYGDGVNIAARIEALADAGGVFVSGTVYEQVRDRLPFVFEDRGEQQVKNISRPVRVYCVLLDEAASVATNEALPLPDKPSIAVLAFTNMSGDAEQEYFSDGIADDIITELSRSHSLFVIARNSSFTYRGRSVDVRQVARELGVRYVLEGSVRRSGDRVRVVAQLIDAETGNHLWAERYDRDLADVFVVQDEITNAVVHAIEPAISHAERQRAIRKAPESLNAWEACHRGLWYMAKHTPEDTKQAQHFFRQACELDTLLATPHALIAECYLHMRGLGGSDRVDQEMAELEVRKAIAIDPGDCTALAALSAISLYYYADYAAAVEHADHAITVNPNDFAAHLVRGRALAFGGRPAEAEEPLSIAMRLSPRDPFKSSALNTLATARYFRRDYAEAAKLEQRAIREYPGYPVPHRWLAASLGQLNRTDEAREALHQAMAISQASFDFFVRQRQPYYRPEDYDHLLDGLRKAGWQG